MSFKNTLNQFGWVSRSIHWITAVLVLVVLVMGFWLTRAELSLATIAYFGYHKTIGFVVLVLFVVRVVWHRYSPVPKSVESDSDLQNKLAHLVHRLFYCMLIAMPLSGWIASSATGIDSVIFNRWTVWSIAPTSEAIADFGFAVHAMLGKALAGLVVLHVCGAMYHAFVLRDGTLRRMIIGARMANENQSGHSTKADNGKPCRSNPTHAVLENDL
ncbi:MAG: cytochrome b [Gammaproteobacteria bacterium]|nr:cytochrome b [Gammaproteobacteria bacterium]